MPTPSMTHCFRDSFALALKARVGVVIQHGNMYRVFESFGDNAA